MAIEAPNSEVDICNLALDLLKQKPIVDLDPPTNQVEELCARWYQQKRRAVLRSHPWNFAMKRIALTPTSSPTPVFGYTHAYNLPSDFIRFAGRFDEYGKVSEPDNEKYEIENGQFLYDGQDNSAIYIRYVFDQAIISKFDPLFIEALALELAIVMAPKFSGTENRVATLLKMRSEVIGEARAIDGQERPPRRRQHSNWIKRRNAGYSTNTADKYTRFS
jgi:hypothetical protein